MSKIAIIVPMYNSAQYIEDTVGSVLAQTYEDWTLILVDDCSTDQTRDVADRMAAADRRISVLSTGKNSGPAHARNIGIQYALSQDAVYLAFLDSDDSYEPDFLERMESAATRSKADMVWCNYYETGRDNGAVKRLVAHPFRETYIDEGAARLFFHGAPGLGSLWNKLYRSSAVRHYGLLLNEERVRAEDWEFNLQLFTRGGYACMPSPMRCTITSTRLERR